MIGRLNHVAIAVPDLAAAVAQYRDTLGAEVRAPQDEPDHGVTVVFIDLPNTKIELLFPLGENSPIAGFLEKNPAGGIHHICYEVEDILAARDRLKASGARVLGSGEPKIGAHIVGSGRYSQAARARPLLGSSTNSMARENFEPSGRATPLSNISTRFVATSDAECWPELA